MAHTKTEPNDCKITYYDTVSAKKVEWLGNPKYIRFLFNTDKKALVIQACENKDPENFRVPEYNPENWDFVVHSSPMLKMIWKVCDWEENQTYRSDGVCYKEHRLVEFDLEQAEILSFVET